MRVPTPSFLSPSPSQLPSSLSTPQISHHTLSQARDPSRKPPPYLHSPTLLWMSAAMGICTLFHLLPPLPDMSSLENETPPDHIFTCGPRLDFLLLSSTRSVFVSYPSPRFRFTSSDFSSSPSLPVPLSRLLLLPWFSPCVPSGLSPPCFVVPRSYFFPSSLSFLNSSVVPRPQLSAQ